MILRNTVLTPAEERRQAPAEGIGPGPHEDEQGPPPRHHPDGGQRSRDDEVAVEGDHRQRDHGADPEESAAERVQLAAWRRRRHS